MNEPESQCLKRFQSLLAGQIEKAKERADKDLFVDGEENDNDNEEEEEEKEEEEIEITTGEGDSNRSPGKASVLLSSFGSPSPLRREQQSPSLWEMESCGSSEAGKQTPDPQLPASGEWETRQQGLGFQDRPAREDINPRGSCAARKRKARTTVTASDAEGSSVSPQKIFIIPAKGRGPQNDSRKKTHHHGHDTFRVIHGTERAENTGLEMTGGGNVRLPETRDERRSSFLAIYRGTENSPPVLQSHTDRHKKRGALPTRASHRYPTVPGLASGSNSGDPRLDRGAVTISSTTPQSSPLSRSTSAAVADVAPSHRRQSRQRLAFTEADGSSNSGSSSSSSTADERRRGKRQKQTRTSDMPNSDRADRGSAVDGNRKSPEPTKPDQACIPGSADDDIDCDFIDRLLSPVRSAGGHRQMSLFHELRQAELQEMNDHQDEKWQIQEKLQHSPLNDVQDGARFYAFSRRRDSGLQTAAQDDPGTERFDEQGPDLGRSVAEEDAVGSEVGIASAESPSGETRAQGLQQTMGECRSAGLQDECSPQNKTAPTVTQQPSDVNVDISDNGLSARLSADEYTNRQQAASSTGDDVIDEVISTRLSTSLKEGTFPPGGPQALCVDNSLQAMARAAYLLRAFSMGLDDACHAFCIDHMAPDITDVSAPRVVSPEEARVCSEDPAGVPRSYEQLNSAEYLSGSLEENNSAHTRDERQGHRQVDGPPHLLTVNNNSLPRKRASSGSRHSPSPTREHSKGRSREESPGEHSKGSRKRKHHSGHRAGRGAPNDAKDSAANPSSSRDYKSAKIAGTSFNTRHPPNCKCMEYDCLRKRGEKLHVDAMKSVNALKKLELLKQFVPEYSKSKSPYDVRINEELGERARTMIEAQRKMLKTPACAMSSACKTTSSPDIKATSKSGHRVLSAGATPSQGSAADSVICGSVTEKAKGSKASQRSGSVSPKATRSLPPPTATHDVMVQTSQSSKSRSLSSGSVVISPKSRKKNEQSPQNSSLRGVIADASGSSPDTRRWGRPGSRPTYTGVIYSSKEAGKRGDTEVGPAKDARSSEYFFSVEVPRPRNRQTLAMRAQRLKDKAPLRTEVDTETRQIVTRSGQTLVTEEMEERRYGATPGMYYYSVSREQKAAGTTNKQPDGAQSAPASATAAVQTLSLNEAKKLMEKVNFQGQLSPKAKSSSGAVYHYATTKSTSTILHHKADPPHAASQVRVDEEARYTVPGKKETVTHTSTDYTLCTPLSPPSPSRGKGKKRRKRSGSRTSPRTVTSSLTSRLSSLASRPDSVPSTQLPADISSLIEKQKQRANMSELSVVPKTGKSPSFVTVEETHTTTVYSPTELPLHGEPRSLPCITCLTGRVPIKAKSANLPSQSPSKEKFTTAQSARATGQSPSKEKFTTAQSARAAGQSPSKEKFTTAQSARAAGQSPPKLKIGTPPSRSSKTAVSGQKSRPTVREMMQERQCLRCIAGEMSQERKYSHAVETTMAQEREVMTAPSDVHPPSSRVICPCVSAMGPRYAEGVPPAPTKKPETPAVSADEILKKKKTRKVKEKKLEKKVQQEVPKTQKKTRNFAVLETDDEEETDKEPTQADIEGSWVARAAGDLGMAMDDGPSPSSSSQHKLATPPPETPPSPETPPRPETPPPPPQPKEPEPKPKEPEPTPQPPAPSRSSPCCRWIRKLMWGFVNLLSFAIGGFTSLFMSVLGLLGLVFSSVVAVPRRMAGAVMDVLGRGIAGSAREIKQEDEDYDAEEGWLQWAINRGGWIGAVALVLQEIGIVVGPYKTPVLTGLLLLLLGFCYMCQCCVQGKDLQKLLDELFRRLALRHMMVPPN